MDQCPARTGSYAEETQCLLSVGHVGLHLADVWGGQTVWGSTPHLAEPSWAIWSLSRLMAQEPKAPWPTGYDK